MSFYALCNLFKQFSGLFLGCYK